MPFWMQPGLLPHTSRGPCSTAFLVIRLCSDESTGTVSPQRRLGTQVPATFCVGEPMSLPWSVRCGRLVWTTTTFNDRHLDQSLHPIARDWVRRCNSARSCRRLVDGHEKCCTAVSPCSESRVLIHGKPTTYYGRQHPAKQHQVPELRLDAVSIGKTPTDGHAHPCADSQLNILHSVVLPTPFDRSGPEEIGKASSLMASVPAQMGRSCRLHSRLGSVS